MKVINNTQTIKLIPEELFNIEEDTLDLTVFTTDDTIESQFKAIIKSNELIIDSTILSNLKEGQIKFKIVFGENNIKYYATNLYLDNNTNSGDSSDSGSENPDPEFKLDYESLTQLFYVKKEIDEMIGEVGYKFELIQNQITETNDQFYTKQQISKFFENTSSIISEVDQKTNQLSEQLNNKLDSSNLSDYYNKATVDNKLTKLDTSINQLETKYVDLTNNVYSKEEVNVEQQQQDTSISKLETDFVNLTNNVYNKEEIDQKIADLGGGSGTVDLTNYYTKSEVDQKILDNKTDLTDYYTKSQVDQKIADVVVGTVDLSDYYTKSQVDQKILDNKTDLTDYYNKEQVNALIPTDFYGKQHIDSSFGAINDKLDSSFGALSNSIQGLNSSFGTLENVVQQITYTFNYDETNHILYINGQN